MTAPSLQQTLADHLALLDRTPAALDALLRGLPDTWSLRNEGPDTWSALDILGHLIHCEQTDWLPRARLILASGEAQPFPPFDRMGHQSFIQDKTLPQLLDQFTALRARNLAEIRSLQLSADDLLRTGLHPAFGSVRLSQLLAAWAAHDLTHLHQLSRVLAAQIGDQVGPFHRFLGVLHCNGHSAPA